MRRIRLPIRRWVLLGAVVVAALVVLLPLRLALDLLRFDRAGLSARAVSGSVWAGRIEDLHVGRLSLGTVDASLSPLGLLIGRARLDLSGERGSHGAITVSRTTSGIDDVTATLPAGDLFAPLPITTLDLTSLSVRFVDGACAHAEGSVRAQVAGELTGLGLGQSLAGTVRCAGTEAVLPLSSASRRERLELRIAANGSTRAELIVADPGPSVAPLLLGNGFVAVPGGYRLRIAGGAG